ASPTKEGIRRERGCIVLGKCASTRGEQAVRPRFSDAGGACQALGIMDQTAPSPTAAGWTAGLARPVQRHSTSKEGGDERAQVRGGGEVARVGAPGSRPWRRDGAGRGGEPAAGERQGGGGGAEGRPRPVAGPAGEGEERRDGGQGFARRGAGAGQARR